MSVETGRTLLEAVKKYRIAAVGDSGDDEHDAANDMADAADAFILNQSGRDIQLACLYDELGGFEVSEEDDENLTDNTCPKCGEKGVAFGAHCNMVDEEVNKYINHYRCAHEDPHRSGHGQPVHEWDDESPAMNNDRCPICNAETEPYASEDLVS